MAYHCTPLESGLSPAELLMGRKIRTRTPTLPSNLDLCWPYLAQVRENDASLKDRQKRDFDRRHCKNPTRTSSWRARLVARQNSRRDRGGQSWPPPRSYTVETPKGQLRRNRRHLNCLPEMPNTDTGTALSSPSPDVQAATSPEPSISYTCGPKENHPKRSRNKTPRAFQRLVTENPGVHLVISRFRNFNQLLQIFLRL